MGVSCACLLKEELGALVRVEVIEDPGKMVHSLLAFGAHDEGSVEEVSRSFSLPLGVQEFPQVVEAVEVDRVRLQDLMEGRIKKNRKECWVDCATCSYSFSAPAMSTTPCTLNS